MSYLTTGIYSEKWLVRRFQSCAKVIECTSRNLDSIVHYTPSLQICGFNDWDTFEKVRPVDREYCSGCCSCVMLSYEICILFHF
jgi:hypothetical protein